MLSFDSTTQHVFFSSFVTFASGLNSSHCIAVHLQGRVLQQELNRLCENGCGEFRRLLLWDWNLDWRVVLCHRVLVCSVGVWSVKQGIEAVVCIRLASDFFQLTKTGYKSVRVLNGKQLDRFLES